MSHLVFRNIQKSFGRRRILDQVGISLAGGECQLLYGDNGAGKSTLLRILAGMERPEQAEVLLDGAARNWRKARKRLQAECFYLHQQPYLFEGSVRYNLNYPLKGTRAARAARIREGLEWSGLEALSEQPVHQLSGGERQRVALVRAWLRGPRVMLLDEPTANMDENCQRRTIELMRTLKDQGMSLLVATHDPGSFGCVAERMLNLHDGRMRETGQAADRLPGNVTPIGHRILKTA